MPDGAVGVAAGRGQAVTSTQDARAGAKEALQATVVLLLSLWIGKHLANATGLGNIIFTGIAAFQLYVPLWLIQRAGEAPEARAA